MIRKDRLLPAFRCLRMQPPRRHACLQCMRKEPNALQSGGNSSRWRDKSRWCAMTALAMKVEMTQGSVCLGSGHALSLPDAAGAQITSLKGRVWLTTEGDLRDI